MSEDGYVSSLRDLIDNIFSNMEGAADLLIGISTTIAGIGCLVYLGTLLLPSIERGERIYFYPLLKPIFVAIVVTNFPIIANGVSDISNGLGSAISEMIPSKGISESFRYFNEKVDTMIQEESLSHSSSSKDSASSLINANSDSTQASSDSNVVSSEKSLGFWDKFMLVVFYKGIIPLLAWIATMLGQILYIGVILFSKFFLLILSIVGPLSFALSQFKMFSGSFSQWLARFISVSLWPGLCGLVRAIVEHIVMAIADNMGTSISSILVSIFLIVFAATLYLHVPTLAEFIIQSGGVGNVGGTAKRLASKVGHKII